MWDKKEKEKYSNQWYNSSSFFYENNDYEWICKQINQYTNVLEIGCGVGYSTLSLIEQGHKVISIDNNEFCINSAKKLIEEKGYKYGSLDDNFNDCNVVFIYADINTISISEIINKFNIVLCWNMGTFWTQDKKLDYYKKFIDFDLTPQEINENFAGCYVDFIQDRAFQIANTFKVPIHFIDRTMNSINDQIKSYYTYLKKIYEYKKITYKVRKTKTKSKGARDLVYDGQIIDKNIIDTFMISILISCKD